MDEEAARGFIYGIANDLFYYLKSWVWFFINQIVAVDKSEAQLSVDLFNYINQHYPKFEWGDLTHFVRRDNSKKIKEFLMRMPKDNAIFWVDGWPVLATSAKGEFDCSEMPRTFFYLRWGIDWSKLMYSALAYKNARNSRQSRFRVLAYTGKKSNSTKRAEMQKEIPMLVISYYVGIATSYKEYVFFEHEKARFKAQSWWRDRSINQMTCPKTCEEARKVFYEQIKWPKSIWVKKEAVKDSKFLMPRVLGVTNTNKTIREHLLNDEVVI